MALKKSQAIIVSTIGLLGQRVQRTKLIKLIYLADQRFHELSGETLTGFSYMWDNYGPNAISNAIVKETEQLVLANKVQMAVRESMYGGDSYIYWTSEQAAADGLAVLSPGERLVLNDVVKQYGRMGVSQIVVESKRTRPFEQAQQYEVLELPEDKNIAALRQHIAANSNLLKDARQGLQDIGRGDVTSQEELDREYDQKD